MAQKEADEDQGLKAGSSGHGGPEDLHGGVPAGCECCHMGQPCSCCPVHAGQQAAATAATFLDGVLDLRGYVAQLPTGAETFNVNGRATYAEIARLAATRARNEHRLTLSHVLEYDAAAALTAAAYGDPTELEQALLTLAATCYAGVQGLRQRAGATAKQWVCMGCGRSFMVPDQQHACPALPDGSADAP